MIRLFVYEWYYTGYTVYGHCLGEDGKYQLLEVRGYLPSCYVEGEKLPRATVVPSKAVRCSMSTSQDVSTRRPFFRVYFDNQKDMDAYASEVYFGKLRMTDVPQLSVFLSQTGARYVGWVEVPALKVRVEDVVPIHSKNTPYADPRVLVFDIEVRSSDAGMPQAHRRSDTVEMISVVTFGDGRPVSTHILHKHDEALGIEGEIVCTDEYDLIDRFFVLVGQEDPTVITGFNIYGFDIAYLIDRLKLRLRDIPNFSRGNKGKVDVVKVDWTSEAYGHNKYDRLVIDGRIILDMYLYFKRMKLDKYSLDFVSNKFLDEGKNDMPHAEMAGAFASGDTSALRKVAEYCIQDSVLVMKLFDKVQMWIDACEVAKITECGIEDIYTRGEQMKLVSQCIRECETRGIVMERTDKTADWKPYEGAYVLDPEKGVYEDCCMLDFQSLYPSIMIANNICPSTYVDCSRYASPLFHNVKRTQDDLVHRFKKSPVGLLPGMLRNVLDERKLVKASMKSLDKSSIEYKVLDRRQNALKICANSVYGLMGFKNSKYFGHLGCAESVTTFGRTLLEDVVRTVESEYPVEVIYGDSVTGYTPTIVRIAKEFVHIETFENLAARWGKSKWIQFEEKEFCELRDVEVWTDEGWTACHRVIRHQLAPHKKILRILTRAGMVDVTDEHSLLDAYGTPINAKDVAVSDTLLHHPYPSLSDANRAAIYENARHRDDIQIYIASMAILDKNGYTLSDTTIIHIHEIQYYGYVYDVTTENHHFQAGPGNIIVHNTDSCMIKPKIKNGNSEEMCKRIAEEVTASLPSPIALMFEAHYDKVVLLTKKRYLLVKKDDAGEPRITYKGVMNARRDYCKFAKNMYERVVHMIALDRTKEDIAEYVDANILSLLSGKCNVSDLAIIKSIARDLKSYKVNQPHVLLARRLVAENKKEVRPGTRLEYVWTKNLEALIIADKMRTIDEMREGDYEIDGMFYIRKQLATQIDDVLDVVGLGGYITNTWR